jgi:uncharacterized protein with HEPN domain
MDIEQEKYLVDVQLAIERIDVHLQQKRDWNLFDKNITIQSAVKYEFSIIGEAIYELLKLKPTFVLTDAVKIVSFRNKMVHEYDAIDNVQVWNVIVNYLPKLEKEVKDLLENKDN